MVDLITLAVVIAAEDAVGGRGGTPSEGAGIGVIIGVIAGVALLFALLLFLFLRLQRRGKGHV